MSSLRRRLPIINSIDSNRRHGPASRGFGVVALVGIIISTGCELRTPPALITVYNPSMKVSLPVPQGWRSNLGDQAGFQMQVFTGPSVDVPERPGIRAQVMVGPMPRGVDLDEVSQRYTEDRIVSQERGYSLHGFSGKTWYFHSEDGDESARLMLTSLEGKLYGLFVRGETPTVEAYGQAIDAMWEGFSIEEARFFESYERPDIGLFLRHPRSWERTALLGNRGESLFVAFRSPPLHLESGGTTIHTTLEVNVNQVPPGTTLEGFYADRAVIQGDSYRLLSHDAIRQGEAISDLYFVETQLAEYLERTIYFIRGDKSYIFKFNAQNTIYRQIEPWIDEMVTTFEPREVE
jgi:hypothetical protein